MSTTQMPVRIKGAPLVGILPRFLSNPPETLLSIATSHPRQICQLNLGPAQAYFVSNPDHIQHILVDNWRNFGKGSMWKATRRLMGNGLVTSEGESWVRSRKLVQPIFNSKRIASLVEGMVAAVDEALSRLEPAARAGATVDVAQEMMHVLQVLFTKVLFGSDIDPAVAEKVSPAIVKALQGINLRAFLFFLPEWFPLPGERELRDAIATIDETVLSLVRDKRARPERESDLLSLLLQARDDETGTGMDDRQLRDELVTLFVAGNDTTAVAMSWMFHVLGEHPRVEEELRTEVRTILGDRRPSAAALPQLELSRMVLQEMMRLYPTGWILPRFSVEEDTIDGVRIPAGSTVLMSEYVTHRDPSLWDQPTRFDPRRFTPERAGARHRFAYFPFGGGPRQCVGNHLAMTAMVIITSMVVQRYRFHPIAGARVVPESTITLRPRGGLKMRVTRA